MRKLGFQSVELEGIRRDHLLAVFDRRHQIAAKVKELGLRVSYFCVVLPGSIDYIHLSDNRGHRVEHLEPGRGAINWTTFFETLELIGFKGEIGLDIGGAESDVGDLDSAYQQAATWVTRQRA